MKKIFVIVLMLTIIIAFQNTSHAQEVGVGDIIFEENTAEVITHGFLINELSYNITKLHLFIAEKNIEATNYEGKTLMTIKRLEELTKTDVIGILNLSTNKEEALAKYLSDCNQELQKWDIISAYMKQEMGILKEDMQSCLVEKNISDKAYFDAIDRYDQSIMQTSLDESIQYETCAAKNRIQYNAKTGIAQKLVFYLWVLQKKYDLLFTKQEILAQNFTVFRDKILPDLTQIDQLLQQYKF
ncbi:MAG: hypothetical protein ACD_80C00145G0044 [uncultured bacterium (gcode 4)]|uniref:Uncharacterized protein n=1 Tax=uncultured bacterium (gcode 4) TaxID=1234023 RepID=K1X473_9BACT|nr:MAG: hypothetical protein ACD_80C00145G0044 [uncultured bacterium (gcode 4)]